MPRWHRRARGIALLLAVLAAGPGAAAAPLTLHYTARWAGLPAGEIELRFEDQPAAYRSQIAIRTEGVPRWFTRFRGHAISEGALAAAKTTPRHYDATYDLRSRKGKRISVRFVPGPDGRVAERGPEDSSEAFLVPPPLRTDVVDPLAALTEMREAVRSGLARKPGRLVIPVFDGKRRFDVEKRALTAETLQVDGAERRVLHLDLMLHPVAGFKDNDPEGNPDDSSRALDVYFSDDEALVPLRLEVKIAWLTTVVELTGRCDRPNSPCRASFE